MNARRLRAFVLAPATALAACAATPPPPATQVLPARLEQAAVPGQTSKAQQLAALGPTRAGVFDSGYEAWLYVAPAGADRYTEFVVLIGPDGVVKKIRQRVP
ncbi:MAG: hypothetical protein ACXWVG_00200 [Telluria sp.]